MHPKTVEDEMGSCPICGMDLVPMKEVWMEMIRLKKLLKKFLTATVFTVPNLIAAMSEEMFSDNPLLELMD